MKRTIGESNDEKNISGGIQLKERCNIRFSPTEREILEFGFQDMNEISTYKTLRIGSEKFSSLAAKSLSTIDFFVELKNIETFGCIKFFICVNNNIYFMLEQFTTKKHIDHIRLVKSLGLDQIFSIKSIKRKLIYMKIVNKEFVSALPNTYEEN